MEAGALLFAERGVAESSVDAIAEAAGRTSGALYDHFGSKDGLLFALLESWVDDVAAVISAELVNTSTLSERMAALWHNVAEPAVGGGRWIALEHELWSYAARNPTAGQRLTDRYRIAWDGIDLLADDTIPVGSMPVRTTISSPADDPAHPASLPIDHPGVTSGERSATGPAVLGLLLGLEMMRRVDPDAVTDDQAVAALCGVVLSTSGPHIADLHSTTPASTRRTSS